MQLSSVGQRSVLRDCLAVILIGGAAGCVVLLGWSGWVLWGQPESAAGPAPNSFSSSLARLRDGLTAIAVTCAVAAYGVYRVFTRFLNTFSEFRKALRHVPTASVGAPALSAAVGVSEYAEAQPLVSGR